MGSATPSVQEPHEKPGRTGCRTLFIIKSSKTVDKNSSAHEFYSSKSIAST